MATKITKSELKQMIREALREELFNSKNVLTEASFLADKPKRVKMLAVQRLMELGERAAAQHIYKYDFAISDTIKPDTVEVNGSTITVHTSFLENTRKFSRMLNAITRAVNAPVTPELDPNSKIVYVLTTFRGKELIYDDFYDAVTDAEGDLVMEANMIDTMYQAPDGTLTEVPESDPNYHRWTEEEGIRT